MSKKTQVSPSLRFCFLRLLSLQEPYSVVSMHVCNSANYHCQDDGPEPYRKGNWAAKMMDQILPLDLESRSWAAII